jgi:PAS domain-containing protein
VVGTHIDVTEQHLAREALQKAFDEIKQSEDRLRLVIDTIPTLVWRAGPDGVPDFLNQTALDYTGPRDARSGRVAWKWTPRSRCSWANSTIRIPFLAARPINTTMPTWA